VYVLKEEEKKLTHTWIFKKIILEKQIISRRKKGYDHSQEGICVHVLE
jgi:hypothetical protein